MEKGSEDIEMNLQSMLEYLSMHESVSVVYYLQVKKIYSIKHELVGLKIHITKYGRHSAL